MKLIVIFLVVFNLAACKERRETSDPSGLFEKKEAKIYTTEFGDGAVTEELLAQFETALSSGKYPAALRWKGADIINVEPKPISLNVLQNTKNIAALQVSGSPLISGPLARATVKAAWTIKDSMQVTSLSTHFLFKVKILNPSLPPPAYVDLIAAVYNGNFEKSDGELTYSSPDGVEFFRLGRGLIQPGNWLYQQDWIVYRLAIPYQAQENEGPIVKNVRVSLKNLGIKADASRYRETRVYFRKAPGSRVTADKRTHCGGDLAKSTYEMPCLLGEVKIKRKK